jgi:hypothetical protein
MRAAGEIARAGQRAGAVTLVLGLVVLVGLVGLVGLAGDARAAFGPPAFGLAQAIDDQPPYSSTVPIAAISCGTPATCVAVDGTRAERTTNAGGPGPPAWSAPAAITNQPIVAVSCAGATLCAALNVNGFVQRSADGGATWQQSPAPIASPGGSGTNRPWSMSCAADGVCALGTTSGGVYLSSDGVATWGTEVALGSVYALSCIAGGTCVAGLDDGRVATSTNAASATPTFTTAQVDERTS